MQVIRHDNTRDRPSKRYGDIAAVSSGPLWPEICFSIPSGRGISTFKVLVQGSAFYEIAKEAGKHYGHKELRQILRLALAKAQEEMRIENARKRQWERDHP